MSRGLRREVQSEETKRTHSKILEELGKQEANQRCADCGSKGPRWASWNLGVWLCIRCSGIHRNLGVHISRVKSTTIDFWTSDEIKSMQNGGNAKAKAFFEANVPRGMIPPDEHTDNYTLEQWIRSKYEYRRFIDTTTTAEKKTTRRKRESKAKGAEGRPAPPAKPKSASRRTTGPAPPSPPTRRRAAPSSGSKKSEDLPDLLQLDSQQDQDQEPAPAPPEDSAFGLLNSGATEGNVRPRRSSSNEFGIFQSGTIPAAEDPFAHTTSSTHNPPPAMSKDDILNLFSQPYARPGSFSVPPLTPNPALNPGVPHGVNPNQPALPPSLFSGHGRGLPIPNGPAMMPAPGMPIPIGNRPHGPMMMMGPGFAGGGGGGGGFTLGGQGTGQSGAVPGKDVPFF